MILDWLHAVAIVSLIPRLICAVWIALDEIRHPQQMWIMNLVWPITALYASVLGLIFHFAYGRLACGTLCGNATTRIQLVTA
jgi:hypothetical protein